MGNHSTLASWVQNSRGAKTLSPRCRRGGDDVTNWLMSQFVSSLARDTTINQSSPETNLFHVIKQEQTQIESLSNVSIHPVHGSPLFKHIMMLHSYSPFCFSDELAHKQQNDVPFSHRTHCFNRSLETIVVHPYPLVDILYIQNNAATISGTRPSRYHPLVVQAAIQCLLTIQLEPK